MSIWAAAAAILVPVVGSELALGGRKLQTGLGRALVVWGLSWLAAAGWLASRSLAGAAVLTAFWSGAFLVWFGVRSHVESSILLRMLFLLRDRPRPDAQVVDAYAAIYGRAQRLAELRHGGFVSSDAAAPRVTRKGHVLLTIVSLLREPSARVPLAIVLALATAVVYGAERWLAPKPGIEAVYTTAAGDTRAVDPVPSRGVVQLFHPDVAAHPFSARWRGFIDVPRSGAYTFRVIADGPIALAVDGKAVVQRAEATDADGASGEIALRSGVHALLIRYGHERGDSTLELWWTPPRGEAELVPASALLRDEVSDTRVAIHRVVGQSWRALVVVWLLIGGGLLVTWLVGGARHVFTVPGEGLDQALAGVLGVSLLLNLWGIWWAMPNVRGWGPDEVVPPDVIDAVRNGFAHGWHQKYPPFHYIVLAIADAPVLLLSWLGLADPQEMQVHVTLVMLSRLVSLAFALGTIGIVYRCGRQLYGRRGAAFAALTMALTVPFAYYAKVANLDAPFMFWFAVSLLAYIRIFQSHATRDYLLFAASAALAGCTKDQIWGAYVLTPFAIVAARWQLWRRSGGPLWRVVVDRNTVLATLTGIAVILVADTVIINPSGFIAHIRLLAGTPAEFQAFPRTLAGQLQMAWRCVHEMQRMFGWPVAIIALVAFVRAVAGRTTTPALPWLLVPALSYYAAFVGAILFYFDRYLFPVTLVLAIFVGFWLDRFLAPAVRARALRLAAVAAAFAYSVVYVAAIDYAMVKDSRYEVTRWLRTHMESGDVIGSFGPLEYFAIAGDLRWTSIDSLEYVAALKPAFIVLSPDQTPSWPARVVAMRDALLSGGAGYRLVLRARSRPLPIPGVHPDLGPAPRHGPELTDLSMINPTIEIFERIGSTP